MRRCPVCGLENVFHLFLRHFISIEIFRSDSSSCFDYIEKKLWGVLVATAAFVFSVGDENVD